MITIPTLFNLLTNQDQSINQSIKINQSINQPNQSIN